MLEPVERVADASAAALELGGLGAGRGPGRAGGGPGTPRRGRRRERVRARMTRMILLQLFIGLSLGSIYVLMASGLSLIFGLMRVVNFGHGSFYMVGAYMLTFVMGLWGNLWIGLVVAPVAIGLLGMLIERCALRPLYGTAEINPLILTLGLNYVLVDLIRIFFGLGGTPSAVPAAFQGMVNLGFMLFPKYRFFMIIVAAVVVVLVWLFINKTNIGMVVRAGTKDGEMVELLGINIRMV
ncbi:MAG: branched-chain amino acid ABC transporter permease, partial [Elusimicrobiota bacterium]